MNNSANNVATVHNMISDVSLHDVYEHKISDDPIEL